MRRVLPLAVGWLAAAVAWAAPPATRTITPADRAWQPFGLVERIDLLGDLTEGRCPSSTLLRLRPDTRLPPHTAAQDRTYLVLSGTIHVGVGKEWDAAELRTLPPGSSWIVPAGTSTFEWSEDEVVCQVTATRPAADCPRPEEPAFFPPGELAWKPDGETERAVLSGDPGRPGCPWTVRHRLPAGTSASPPAAPPGGDRVVTVISGTLRAAPGPGGAAPTEFPAGTVQVSPGGVGPLPRSGADAVVESQFAGTGSPACRWRELHRR
jgi:mannose-6-phosphate isomerase-like protein (cupin superfamily)